MRSFLILVAWTYFSCLPCVQAQKYTEYEQELSSDINDEHIVIPLLNQAAVVANLQEKTFSRKAQLKLYLLNKDLEKVWDSTFDIPKLFEMEKYYHVDNNLHFLFKKESEEDIIIVHFDLETGEYQTYENSLLTEMDIKFLSFINGKYIIAGEYENSPAAELHTILDRSTKVFPQFYSRKHELQNIEVIDQKIYFFLKESKNCDFWIYRYDEAASNLEKTKIKNGKYTALDARKMIVPQKSGYIIGNYGWSCNDFSLGFYIINIDNLSEVKLIPFSSLNNYFSHLPKKRQERLEEKARKKYADGKTGHARVRCFITDPEVMGDKLYLKAEIFYPEYKSSDYVRTRITRLGNQFAWEKDFNNYRFSNTLICEIDTNLKVSWDYSIPLKNVESNTLSPKSHFFIKKDSITAAYITEDKLQMAQISKPNQLKELKKINLKKEQVAHVVDLKADLFHWYDGHFLIYGYKDVRREALHLNQVQFFYVRKLSLDYLKP
jgi:hypothetical protein